MGAPALILLLSLAFIAIALVVGFVWLERIRAKVEVEREKEFRNEFQPTPLPPWEQIVQVVVQHDQLRTVETACHETGVGWIDPHTLRPIQGEVLGWRKHVFPQEPRRRDPETWTDDELKAELGRMFAADDGPSDEPDPCVWRAGRPK